MDSDSSNDETERELAKRKSFILFFLRISHLGKKVNTNNLASFFVLVSYYTVVVPNLGYAYPQGYVRNLKGTPDFHQFKIHTIKRS